MSSPQVLSAQQEAIEAANALYDAAKTSLDQVIDSVTSVFTYLEDRAKTKPVRDAEDRVQALWDDLASDDLEGRQRVAGLMNELCEIARRTYLDANYEPKETTTEQIAAFNSYFADAMGQAAKDLGQNIIDPIKDAADWIERLAWLALIGFGIYVWKETR